MQIFYFFSCLLNFISTSNIDKYNTKYESSLSLEDLKSPNNFIIFVFYEQENFICPVCEIFKKKLHSHRKYFKSVNFSENTELASKFFCFTFPSIFYKKGGEFYAISYNKIEKLMNLDEKNVDVSQFSKVSKFLNPTGRFASVFSMFISVTFKLFLKAIVIRYYVPEKVYMTMFICILFYFVFQLIPFKRDVEKEDLDQNK